MYVLTVLTRLTIRRQDRGRIVNLLETLSLSYTTYPLLPAI